MKKTKIIIPALGMLLLSTAASVTGTVAWFTSVSTANSNLTSFAIRKVGGALDVKVKTGAQNSDDGAAGSANEAPSVYGLTNYGYGTSLTDGSVTLGYTGVDQVYMTHGSYDHKNDKAYKPTNSAATAFAALNPNGSDWFVAGTDASNHSMRTYFAVSWTLIFNYEFGGDTTPINLYFNGAASGEGISSVTKTANNPAEGQKETYKGFRLAFVNSAASRSLVWADNQTYDKCSYLTATNGDPADAFGSTSDNVILGSYTSPNSTNGDLIDSSGVVALDADASGATTRADYLGQFTPSSTRIIIKCVAWFEGTDENVINSATLDTVAAALAFYTRNNQSA